MFILAYKYYQPPPKTSNNNTLDKTTSLDDQNAEMTIATVNPSYENSNGGAMNGAKHEMSSEL